MKPLGFAPLARADLVAIADYIAADNPERAETFVEELAAKARKAAEHPQAYPLRDDIDQGLRSIVHGRYLILFRELADEVRVVRVIHGARDLKRLFE